MLVSLIRTEMGEEGTFGILLAKGKRFETVELPWHDNQKGISCIPYGEYECEIVNSPKFGRVYQVKDVDERTHILFHWGNWAGDMAEGFRSDSDGCILIGMKRSYIYGQKAVGDSRTAVKKFNELMNHEPFTLIVSGLDIW